MTKVYIKRSDFLVMCRGVKLLHVAELVKKLNIEVLEG